MFNQNQDNKDTIQQIDQEITVCVLDKNSEMKGVTENDIVMEDHDAKIIGIEQDEHDKDFIKIIFSLTSRQTSEKWNLEDIVNPYEVPGELNDGLGDYRWAMREKMEKIRDRMKREENFGLEELKEELIGEDLLLRIAVTPDDSYLLPFLPKSANPESIRFKFNSL